MQIVEGRSVPPFRYNLIVYTIRSLQARHNTHVLGFGNPQTKLFENIYLFNPIKSFGFWMYRCGAVGHMHAAECHLLHVSRPPYMYVLYGCHMLCHQARPVYRCKHKSEYILYFIVFILICI